MTQRLEQIHSSLSTSATLNDTNTNNPQDTVTSLKSAFDQPDIQNTLTKTQLQPVQLTHTPDLKKFQLQPNVLIRLTIS